MAASAAPFAQASQQVAGRSRASNIVRLAAGLAVGAASMFGSIAHAMIVTISPFSPSNNVTLEFQGPDAAPITASDPYELNGNVFKVTIDAGRMAFMTFEFANDPISPPAVKAYEGPTLLTAVDGNGDPLPFTSAGYVLEQTSPTRFSGDILEQPIGIMFDLREPCDSNEPCHYEDPAQIKEPSPLPMLAAGLLVLGGLARRQQRLAAT